LTLPKREHTRGPDPVHWVPVTVIAAAALFLCCTPAHRMSGGQAALGRGDYQEAVSLLESEVADRPQDWERVRDLGVALYRSGRHEEARARLETAFSALPGDGVTHYYLGAACEQLGDYDAAVNAYTSYSDERPSWLPESTMGRRIRQRADLLARTMAVDQARERIRNEALLAQETLDERVLAVVPFVPSGTPETTRPLAAAMAEWLATDLAKIRHLRLVERLQMDAILQELDLAGDGEALEPGTCPRIGRLVGAGRLVAGSLLQAGEDRVRVDVSIIDSRTREVVVAETAEGETDRFFQVEKRLVFGLLTKLGIEPSPAERSSIGEIPTRNLQAALSYGRGLLAERRGEYGEAELAYREALDQDRGFQMADRALLAVPSESPKEPDRIAPGVESWAHDEDPFDADSDRLAATDEMTGGDFWSPEPVEGAYTPAPTIPDPPPLPDPRN